VGRYTYVTEPAKAGLGSQRRHHSTSSPAPRKHKFFALGSTYTALGFTKSHCSRNWWIMYLPLFLCLPAHVRSCLSRFSPTSLGAFDDRIVFSDATHKASFTLLSRTWDGLAALLIKTANALGGLMETSLRRTNQIDALLVRFSSPN